MFNNKSKTRNYALLFLLLAILFISIIVQVIFNKSNKLNSTENNTQITKQSTASNRNTDSKPLNKVTLDFGDGNKVTSGVSADSAFKALTEITAKQGYKVETKNYKYGLMVESINKVKNNSQQFWMYSVNNKPGQIAADRYILAPGDTVEWKYTSAK